MLHAESHCKRGHSVTRLFLDFLSYPRALVMTVAGILLTLIMCFVMLFLALVVRSRTVVDWAIVWLWSKPLVWPVGVRVDVRGGELVKNTPKGFLILFNHSSLIDIPILYGYFPRSFRFGAKIELFKIPFFGWAMAACGVLPIDRGSRSKVMRVYDSAIARINNGECFALAPEGTRQSEAQLGKFKRGPFEFAINAKMDIVPVVLGGALKVLPKYSYFVNMGRWRRKVIMEITPPIPASEYSIETIEALQAKVRAQMEAAFVRANAELDL
jgi:1-acyl-sn-glycerol-3-phosphate acyltransferase